MGHEFTGEIVNVGEDVRLFAKGDGVVSAFTTSWYASFPHSCSISADAQGKCSGECFYCKQGFSSRCEKHALFGYEKLDGGQAEYVSVPSHKLPRGHAIERK